MSHRMAPAVFAVFLRSVFLVALSAAAQAAEANIATRDSVSWNPAPFPGITIATAAGNPAGSGMYAIFVKFAPGARALPHTHPDQRIVTVLSGVIQVGIGAEFDLSKAMVLKAGSIVIIPAGAPHYGWTTDSEALLQEVGTAPTGTKIWPVAAAR